MLSQAHLGRLGMITFGDGRLGPYAGGGLGHIPLATDVSRRGDLIISCPSRLPRSTFTHSGGDHQVRWGEGVAIQWVGQLRVLRWLGGVKE